MTEQECKSIFLLAGIDVERVWELPNGYWPRPKLPRTLDTTAPADWRANDYWHYAKLREESPWWLVKTPFGLIEIGWRKRVISIDWTDTGIGCDVTADDTTKDSRSVHAWSVEDAVKYLRVLGEAVVASAQGSSPRGAAQR